MDTCMLGALYIRARVAKKSSRKEFQHRRVMYVFLLLCSPRTRQLPGDM